MASRAQNKAKASFSQFRQSVTSTGRRIITGLATFPDGRQMRMEVPTGRGGGAGSNGG